MSTKEKVQTKLEVKKNWVVKSNRLIESRGKLTPTEHKLFAAAVSMITPYDEDFKVYEIDLNQLKKDLKVTSNNMYPIIKNAADNLAQIPVRIESVDSDGKKEFMRANLIASAAYKQGESVIRIRISPDLKPHLLNLKGAETPYTKYKIENVLRLKSSHSIKLYELLAQYSGMKVKERKFEIEEFKTILGVDGKYPSWSDLDLKVLAKCVQEINKKTNMKVSYENIKTGRSTTHIVFKFTINLNAEEMIENELKELQQNNVFDYEDLKIKAGLADCILSYKQLDRIYTLACDKTDSRNYDPYAYIKGNYEYVKSIENYDIDNMTSFLIAAIENDYGKVLS